MSKKPRTPAQQRAVEKMQEARRKAIAERKRAKATKNDVEHDSDAGVTDPGDDHLDSGPGLPVVGYDTRSVSPDPASTPPADPEPDHDLVDEIVEPATGKPWIQRALGL